MEDPHNRVAGNALLALYRLGNASSIAGLARMASDEREKHRATAAWAIGETGDPRFTAELSRLMADADPSVRAPAHRSMVRIRAATARTRRLEGISIVVGQPRRLGEDLMAAQIALPAGSDGHAAGWKPTQFIPIVGDRPQAEFRVEPLAAPHSIALELLLPRHAETALPWIESVRAGLEAKRDFDSWAVTRYGEGEGEGIEAAGPTRARYSASPQIIGGLLQAGGDGEPGGPAMGMWRAVRLSAASGSGPQRGRVTCWCWARLPGTPRRIWRRLPARRSRNG